MCIFISDYFAGIYNFKLEYTRNVTFFKMSHFVLVENYVDSNNEPQVS